MNKIRQDYLISWFHPTECTLKLDVPHWVSGRNEDFGFEVICANVRATDPEAAKQFIRSRYDLPGFEVTFRFCNPQAAASVPVGVCVNTSQASLAA